MQNCLLYVDTHFSPGLYKNLTEDYDHENLRNTALEGF